VVSFGAEPAPLDREPVQHVVPGDAREVEALEERRHLGAEVGEVHVVDEVVEGPEDAEGAGRVDRLPAWLYESPRRKL